MGSYPEPLIVNIDGFSHIFIAKDIDPAIYVARGCGKRRCREPTRLFPPETLSQAPSASTIRNLRPPLNWHLLQCLQIFVHSKLFRGNHTDNFGFRKTDASNGDPTFCHAGLPAGRIRQGVI